MDKLRRTMMFVPGANPGMLRDAPIYGADAIMFDLEDAVSLKEKDTARMLVYSALKPFDYSKADQKIKQSRAISVMFSKPNGKTYQDMLDVFNDPELMEELNRPIFYYPIVYDVHELEQKYNIRTDEVTFIFFDGGKEANRITAGKGGITDFDKELIPELNRLPLANIKQLEEELDRTGVTSQNSEIAN